MLSSSAIQSVSPIELNHAAWHPRSLEEPTLRPDLLSRQHLIARADHQPEIRRDQSLARSARRIDLRGKQSSPENQAIDRGGAVHKPARRRRRALRESERRQAHLAIGPGGHDFTIEVVEIAHVVVDLGETVLAGHPRGAHARARARASALPIEVESVQRLGRDDQPARPRDRAELLHERARELGEAMADDPDIADRGRRVAKRAVPRGALHRQVVLGEDRLGVARVGHHPKRRKTS
jgi:hypothetical protein